MSRGQITKRLMLGPVALAIAVSTGAAGRAQDRGAEKQNKSTGIPECDKYFAMADACIASKKMSKEDQRAAELNVNRLRTMLPIARAPQGRATLAQRCTASLEAAQKDDKYSCYASPAKPAEGGR